MIEKGILISWLAVANDPYRENERGQRVLGPTLTFLLDDHSEYRNRISRCIFFMQKDAILEQPAPKEKRILSQIRDTLMDQAPGIKTEERLWPGQDPTAHEPLFEFVKVELLQIRQRYPTIPLFVHISPGTPAMHTAWILAVSTGLIDGPVTLVQTVPPDKRPADAPATKVVRLQTDAILQVFRTSRPEVEPVHEAPLKLYSGPLIACSTEMPSYEVDDHRSLVLPAVYERARRLARLRVPILILGERGTGKTTLAAWIRSNSPFRRADRDRSWPSVACGQYSGETIRAELFGYKKGAYTGADEDKEGLLARADGDTLFLDEIADLSRDLQRLLIRALEEGSYLPLGGKKPEHSTFRLITATNRSWAELQERLDPDFLDRISIYRLTIPPLRQTPEEIPLLWRQIYETACERADAVGVPRLTWNQHEHVIGALQHHPLPGNRRDLLRVAYLLIASMDNSVGAPVPFKMALEEALHSLSDGASSVPASVAQAVAAAFSSGTPLDSVLPAGTRIETREIVGDVQRYLASEILRMKKAARLPLKDLTDVSERTLYSWSGNNTA